LARPRELPRRPFELAVSFAVALPSCQPGSINDQRCASVDSGPGLDAAVLYRVNPFFGVGVEGAFVGFGRNGGGAFSNAGNAKFFGALGRVYFADSGLWDPYLSLTLGVGTLGTQGLHGSAQLSEGTTGFGGRIAGGVDVLLGTHLRVGPTASFAHWLAGSERRCVAGVCQSGSLVHGRLVGFATLGLRVSASWGDGL